MTDASPSELQTDSSADGQAAESRPAPMIPRHKVVRRLLGLYEAPRYLEIGVYRGSTFHRVQAAEQVAVDPVFLFDVAAEGAQRPHATYHAVTSDEYFGRIIGEDELFDVIFLDGLHTFDQTLRDLLNALDHLASGGVILIDDVRPPFYEASLADQAAAVRARQAVGQTSTAWMGDVYRLLWFIDTFCQGLTYRTISNNHGQAVVWRQRRDEVTVRTVRQTAELSFQDYLLEPDLLNLRTFHQIYTEIRPLVGQADAPEKGIGRRRSGHGQGSPQAPGGRD